MLWVPLIAAEPDRGGHAIAELAQNLIPAVDLFANLHRVILRAVEAWKGPFFPKFISCRRSGQSKRQRERWWQQEGQDRAQQARSQEVHRVLSSPHLRGRLTLADHEYWVPGRCASRCSQGDETGISQVTPLSPQVRLLINISRILGSRLSSSSTCQLTLHTEQVPTLLMHPI